MNDKSEVASCATMAHSGGYSLDSNEELVVISYPGPPRVQVTGNAGAAHQFRLPDLLPIVTVPTRQVTSMLSSRASRTSTGLIRLIPPLSRMYSLTSSLNL